jgi:hypothetical protein
MTRPTLPGPHDDTDVSELSVTSVANESAMIARWWAVPTLHQDGRRRDVHRGPLYWLGGSLALPKEWWAVPTLLCDLLGDLCAQ